MLHNYRIVIYFCLFFALLQSAVMAQCTITGNVKDSLNSPIPYAAVGLLNAKDSAILKGTLGNDSGTYSFTKVKAGIYLLKVSVTGYPEKFSNIIKLDSGQQIIVPPFRLKSTDHNLKAVEVVAQKPFMEHKNGMMAFNIENSIISVGKNALEMMNDLPGITASENGGISIMGKTGILLLVDGKTLPVDPVNFLKGIDASQIERVEVITNPSAKYQAEGKAVINIILKKNKNIGLNGELTSTERQGFYLASTEGLNLDYRTNKWNFSLDASTNIFHRAFIHTITRTFGKGPSAEVFDENAPWFIHGTYSFGSIGIDFTPDKKQTFSFSSYFELQFEHMSTYDNTIMHTTTSIIDSSLYTVNTRYFQMLHAIPGLSYKYKPDTTEKELSIQLLYGPFHTKNTQQDPVNYYNSLGLEMRPSTLSNSNEIMSMNIWSFQLDYTQPISNKVKLDAGVYELYGTPNNNVQFWNDVNGLQIIDTTKTNQFDFKENILAGYLNYSEKLSEKTDFQVGLRAEQTNDKGMQYVHDTSFTRNYLNLFPSASFNWKPSDNNAFALSYTRRIDRPGFDQLNPFITVIDPYTYTEGNIALLPQLSDNYEIDYSFKQIFTVALLHTYITNVMSSTYTQNDITHVSTYIPVNLGYYSGYNINFITNFNITKWWRTVNWLHLYVDNFYGNYDGVSFNRINPSFYFKTLNTLTFKKGWSAEVSFVYNYINIDGLNTYQPVSEFDAGISKHFLNDRLIVTVSCSDILKTNIDITTLLYQDVNIRDYAYGDYQELRVGLTWKFGRRQNKKNENENILPTSNLKGVK